MVVAGDRDDSVVVGLAADDDTDLGREEGEIIMEQPAVAVAAKRRTVPRRERRWLGKPRMRAQNDSYITCGDTPR